MSVVIRTGAAIVWHMLTLAGAAAAFFYVLSRYWGDRGDQLQLVDRTLLIICLVIASAVYLRMTFWAWSSRRADAADYWHNALHGLEKPEKRWSCGLTFLIGLVIPVVTAGLLFVVLYSGILGSIVLWRWSPGMLLLACAGLAGGMLLSLVLGVQEPDIKVGKWRIVAAIPPIGLAAIGLLVASLSGPPAALLAVSIVLIALLTGLLALSVYLDVKRINSPVTYEAGIETGSTTVGGKS